MVAYESLTGINDARGKIVRDKGPKEFFVVRMGVSKDRERQNVARRLGIPELAGKGFKKVHRDGGQDFGAAVAGDLTDPVKVLQK